MNPSTGHRIVAASMITTALVVALSRDWIGKVREWILRRTH